MKPLTDSQVKKARADIDLLNTDVSDCKAAKKAFAAQERMSDLFYRVEDKLYKEWGEDIDNSKTY